MVNPRVIYKVWKYHTSSSVPKMLYFGEKCQCSSASWSPVALPRGSGIIPEELLLAWSLKSAKYFSIWKPQHHIAEILKPGEEREGQETLKQRKQRFARSCSFFPSPSLLFQDISHCFPGFIFKQASPGATAAKCAVVQPLAPCTSQGKSSSQRTASFISFVSFPSPTLFSGEYNPDR